MPICKPRSNVTLHPTFFFREKKPFWSFWNEFYIKWNKIRKISLGMLLASIQPKYLFNLCFKTAILRESFCGMQMFEDHTTADATEWFIGPNTISYTYHWKNKRRDWNKQRQKGKTNLGHIIYLLLPFYERHRDSHDTISSPQNENSW